MDTLEYTVRGMSCRHCEASVKEEVGLVPGVARVAVDLKRKRVEVHGTGLDDAAIRAAIAVAGYEAA
jgi:copper chaperone